VGAGYGKTDVIKLLVARGADLNARDDRGKTALAIAEEANQLDAVKLLKDAGARP